MIRMTAVLGLALIVVMPDATGGRIAAGEAGQGERILVALGDSITKGVRAGVKAEETFTAALETELRAKKFPVKGINLGIGGERTDQALARMEQILSHKPALATVMYGTNDSYVDKGKTAPRLTRQEYKNNLKKIVAELRGQGIRPILMTPPRWAKNVPPNGAGEDPNVRLSEFARACREAAEETKVPLVDHFALWTEAEKQGTDLHKWTTDGYHPNPLGHQKIAEAALPILIKTLQGENARLRQEAP